LLIDEISGAALEAIEQAAAEGARAAALAMLEREAAALHEAQKWRIKADNYLQDIKNTKSEGKKNTVIAAFIGIFAGLTVGIGGTLLIGGR
jgi:hypothetical protein